jgi:cell division protein FtsQ
MAMKKWLKIAFWVLFIVSVSITLGLTKSTQANTIANTPQILIHVDGEYTFLTEDDLLLRLKSDGLIYDNQIMQHLDVNKLEQFIANMPEVKSVDVFTDIGNNWNIELTLRKPIARIFNKKGESFYLDAEGKSLPTSPVHTARLLVFSGEIADDLSTDPVDQIINNDSLKSILSLDDVYRISNYVCNDPFLHALIGQVYVQKGGQILLIPLVGEQVIEFGKAETEKMVADKFSKLKVFYREAIPYEGWERYKSISLKYDNQIVCTKRDELETKEK